MSQNQNGPQLVGIKTINEKLTQLVKDHNETKQNTNTKISSHDKDIQDLKNLITNLTSQVNQAHSYINEIKNN